MNTLDKAAMREQIAARRKLNSAVAEYSPIVWRQTRTLASGSGLSYELLEGVAFEGLAYALVKGDQNRPGFYSFVKLYVRGYLCNYLRDKSRAVRLPRSLSLTYLAEQKALRDTAGYRDLPDSIKAALLGVTVETLHESRTAIGLNSQQLDFHDKCDDAQPICQATQTAADLVTLVVDTGCRVLAQRAKSDPEQAKTDFYAALKLVLDQHYATD